MNNKTPEFWDEAFSKKINYTELSQDILEKLFTQKGNISSFLDLGCGSGSLMRIMEEKGIQTTGVEWSQEAIKLAQENSTQGIIYHQNLDEIEDFNLNKNYDVISIKLVLAFISNKATILKWCKEHLKDNGLLIVHTPVSTKTIPSLKSGIAMKDLEVKNLLEMTFEKVELVQEETTGVGIVQTYFCF